VEPFSTSIGFPASGISKALYMEPALGISKLKGMWRFHVEGLPDFSTSQRPCICNVLLSFMFRGFVTLTCISCDKRKNSLFPSLWSEEQPVALIQIFQGTEEQPSGIAYPNLLTFW
jgi:hypothetical protein